MLVALISDIHSNHEALQAVLAEVKKNKPEKIVCLGDVVGYGADPVLVLETLANLNNLEIIMGNHDQAVLDKNYRKLLNYEAQQVITWTESKLDKRWLGFMQQFKNQIEKKELQGIFFHSSPEVENDYLIYPQQISSFLKVQESQRGKGWLYMGGHTHLRTLANPRTMLTLAHDYNGVCRKKLSAQVSYYINPGSVGQPRGALGLEASFALLDFHKREFVSRLVAYDFEPTQKKILKAGLPAFFAARLAKGT